MKIHFVGIKGVGMAPLAIIAKEAGFVVTGSDVDNTYITDEVLKNANILPQVGFDQSRIEGVDLVITTGAHGGLSNLEVVAAKEKGIEIWLQGQAVGKFMEGSIFERSQFGISVAGCHGKTTTSAFISTLLEKGDMNPSYVIGTGIVPSLGSSGHFGSGKYFVAEADEYATEPNVDKTAKFMWQHPNIAVITNIEFDHPDLYTSLDKVRDAYEKFAGQLASDGGLLVVNGDDPQVKTLLETYEGEVITFGQEKDNDYVIELKESGKFVLSVEQENWKEEFSLEIPGVHNIKNATAAIVVARELGLANEKIQNGLSSFSGTKRRLEYQGTFANGALLYDDYAHHPTEIMTTLQALKEKYPDKKIIVAFQPHTFSRTKQLFQEFIDALIHADVSFLIEIYPSAREEFDSTISSRLIAQELHGKDIDSKFFEKAQDMVQYIRQNQDQFDSNTILITMGAGDIYQVADELLKI